MLDMYISSTCQLKDASSIPLYTQGDVIPLILSAFFVIIWKSEFSAWEMLFKLKSWYVSSSSSSPWIFDLFTTGNALPYLRDGRSAPYWTLIFSFWSNKLPQGKSYFT